MSLCLNDSSTKNLHFSVSFNFYLYSALKHISLENNKSSEISFTSCVSYIFYKNGTSTSSINGICLILDAKSEEIVTKYCFSE